MKSCQTVNTQKRYHDVLRKVRNHQGPIGFDTETNGASVLVASKMKLNPYTSFLVGYSFSLGDDDNYYVGVQHKNKKDCLDLLDADTLLLEVLKCRQIWAHNWKYDYSILQTHFADRKPFPEKYCLDSMIGVWFANMHSAKLGLKTLEQDLLGIEADTFEDTVKGKSFAEITPKQATKYAAQDAWASLKLGEMSRLSLVEQGLWEQFREFEMPFVFVLQDMERSGMKVNSLLMGELAKELRGKIWDILDRWKPYSQGSIGSPKTWADMYESGKWDSSLAEKTATGNLAACKQSMLNHLTKYPAGSDTHESAKVRLEYQDAYKIYSTYTLNLIRAQQQYPDRRLHADFNHTGVRTGRLSSANPNLQNIPVRSAIDTDYGARVKQCFIPEPGNVLLSADYSQIELRVIAHLCGGKGKLAEAYINGKDIHQETADAVGSSRQQAKTINFASVYGAGPAKLAKQIGVSFPEGKKFLEQYHKAYPEVGQLRDACVRATQNRGYVRTLLGRHCNIPHILDDPKSPKRWGAERKAFNTPVQGGAADIMKVAMVKFRKWLTEEGLLHKHVKIVAAVHDELCCEVTDDVVIRERVKTNMQRIMENAWPGFRVPLVAEPSFGYNWGECK